MPIRCLSARARGPLPRISTRSSRCGSCDRCTSPKRNDGNITSTRASEVRKVVPLMGSDGSIEDSTARMMVVAPAPWRNLTNNSVFECTVVRS
jgi:hypothetical protein